MTEGIFIVQRDGFQRFADVLGQGGVHFLSPEFKSFRLVGRAQARLLPGTAAPLAEGKV
jgi:hypothetical protein